MRRSCYGYYRATKYRMNRRNLDYNSYVEIDEAHCGEWNFLAMQRYEKLVVQISLDDTHLEYNPYE